MVTDIKWDGQDIVRAPDGDIQTVTGTENIEQSLAILVRDEIDDVIGKTITPGTLAEMEDALSQAVSRDPQVTGIVSLSITEINKQDNTISVKAETSEDETFVSEIDL